MESVASGHLLPVPPRPGSLRYLAPMAKDFLDQIIAARTRTNPAFPERVAEAAARRNPAHPLAGDPHGSDRESGNATPRVRSRS